MKSSLDVVENEEQFHPEAIKIDIKLSTNSPRSHEDFNSDNHDSDMGSEKKSRILIKNNLAPLNTTLMKTNESENENEEIADYKNKTNIEDDGISKIIGDDKKMHESESREEYTNVRHTGERIKNKVNNDNPVESVGEKCIVSKASKNNNSGEEKNDDIRGEIEISTVMLKGKKEVEDTDAIDNTDSSLGKLRNPSKEYRQSMIDTDNPSEKADSFAILSLGTNMNEACATQYADFDSNIPTIISASAPSREMVSLHPSIYRMCTDSTQTGESLSRKEDRDKDNNTYDDMNLSARIKLNRKEDEISDEEFSNELFQGAGKDENMQTSQLLLNDPISHSTSETESYYNTTSKQSNSPAHNSELEMQSMDFIDWKQLKESDLKKISQTPVMDGKSHKNGMYSPDDSTPNSSYGSNHEYVITGGPGTASTIADSIFRKNSDAYSSRKEVKIMLLIAVGVLGFFGFIGCIFIQFSCHFATGVVAVGEDQQEFQLRAGMWKFSSIDSVFMGYEYCSPYNSDGSSGALLISQIAGLTAILMGIYSLIVLWFYLLFKNRSIFFWSWAVKTAYLASILQPFTLVIFTSNFCSRHSCGMGPGSIVTILASVSWFLLAYAMHHHDLPFSASIANHIPVAILPSHLEDFSQKAFDSSQNYNRTRINENSLYHPPPLCKSAYV